MTSLASPHSEVKERLIEIVQLYFIKKKKMNDQRIYNYICTLFLGKTDLILLKIN